MCSQHKPPSAPRNLTSALSYVMQPSLWLGPFFLAPIPASRRTRGHGFVDPWRSGDADCELGEAMFVAFGFGEGADARTWVGR
jgi:hypothetical protein